MVTGERNRKLTLGDTRYLPAPSRLRDPLHGWGPTPLTLLRATCWPTQVQRLFRQEVLSCPVTDQFYASGTDALYVALQQASCGPDDEIIFATFNCPQVADAVICVGASPVLCDVDTTSGVATVAHVEPHISPRTKAIIITHQFGRLEGASIELAAWARARGLVVIDDAAQSLGARYAGEEAGALGDYGVFSFGPSKPIGLLGGGMLKGLHVSRTWGSETPKPKSPQLWKQSLTSASLLRRFASAPPRQSGRFKDVHAALEAKLPAVPTGAALDDGRSELIKLSLRRSLSVQRSRERKWRFLLEAVSEVGLHTVGSLHGGSNFAFAWLRVDAARRWEFGERLALLGFQVGWYHLPLHHLSRYRPVEPRLFPGADGLWPQVVQVPFRYLSWRRLRVLVRSLKQVRDVLN